MRTHYDNLNFKAACIALALSLPVSALADEAADFFKNVLDNANLCAYGKDRAARTDCYIKAAPDKCENEAIKFLATQNRELFYCAASCVNAGVASRSIGECSRELDRENAGVELANRKREAEEVWLSIYWSRAEKANSEVIKIYPYLAVPQTKIDRDAASNFEFLKKKYLTVNADSREAVYRAASETDSWHSRVGEIAAKEDAKRQAENVRFQNSAPITSEMADAILGSSPARSGSSSPPGCVFSQIMDDEDYKACGITPP